MRFVTTSHFWKRYGLASLLTALAAVASLGLKPLIEQIPAALFFVAVLISAWYGGLGPGVLASLLSTLVVYSFFLSQAQAPPVVLAQDLVEAGVILLVMLLISALMAARKQAEAVARRERERLRVTLTSIGDGVITTDTQGQVMLMNEVAQSLTGWQQAEAAGKPIEEVFRIVNDETRITVENPTARVLREGVIAGLANHTLLVTKTGKEIPIDDSGAPIRDDQGALTGVVLVFRDITERKRAELSLHLLAEAGHLLASSLDYNERLSNLTRLVVPALADWCAVDVLDNDGAIRRVAVAHVDPAKVELAHELQRRYPVDPNAPRGVPHVLRTGESEFYPYITDSVLAAATDDPELLQVLRNLGLESGLTVPLIARERTLGVLSLVMAESGRHYDQADLNLANELARRAALALDNARLYAETQTLNAQLEDRILERTQRLRATVNELRREISERQQAEEKIRQNERRLAEAQHIGQFGSWYWDISTNTLTWSEELYHIYGQNPQTFGATYEAFLEAVHPDDREMVQNIIAQAYQEHRPIAFDHRIVRPDGTIRTLHARGEVNLDATGQLVAMEGTGQDITERKQAEEALHNSREQLRRLSARLQAVREEERTRMAREIHDQLGGAMTGLKMDVAALRRNLQAALLEKTSAISELIDGTIQTVRRIATELRPAILDDFGLLAAIEWQLQEFQTRANIRCNLSAEADDIPLDPESSTAVFRVFQETLTNVARHANATEVEVRIEEQAGHLILRVHDNGRGISEAEISGSKSLGLVGMQERIHLLSGELDIRGAPGQGTTILVKIPLGKVKSNQDGSGEKERAQ